MNRKKQAAIEAEALRAAGRAWRDEIDAGGRGSGDGDRWAQGASAAVWWLHERAKQIERGEL